MGNNKLLINSTQVPNYILDELMPLLSDTEFRVLMVITRQTYGWHKETDQISYSQLVEKTGSSRRAVATALKVLREKGIIKVTDSNGTVIKTKEEAQTKQELYYSINITTSAKIAHVPVQKLHTQKKILSLSEDKSSSRERKTYGLQTVNQVLEEFSEVTGLERPADRTPRNWAAIIARSKEMGVNHFRPCLEYLQNDCKLTITKLETVYRQFPLYKRDVLKISTKRLTQEQEEIEQILRRHQT